jgi:hypothetical protein
MTNADLLPPAVLKRKAVDVTQSTQAQVQSNLESQRRQYELVDEARRRGSQDIEVVDDDLGRTASGMVDRPVSSGWWRSFARARSEPFFVSTPPGSPTMGTTGIICSNFAAGGSRVIDLDGVYDPCRPNDRLLLVMKGSISEFELSVLRTRMYHTARAMARRGELRISVPGRLHLAS